MIRNKRILSISELTLYLQDIIENEPRLSNLWLRGEVSNVKKPSSGHIYFSLKDGQSIINCVLFKSNRNRVQSEIEEGMEVVARGNLGIYSGRGQYQLYVQEIQVSGTGSLYIEFEKLKKMLREEGLFDSIHKKDIPYCPHCIGIVTSQTGSVLRDIISIVSRRYSGTKLLVVPASVQGYKSSDEITEGIKKLNKISKVEVIITARGGGSLEELWAFNTEKVARAIFKSKIPVVNAVGHETDFTISDFVADLRAPTPSAAAELLVPQREEIEERIKHLSIRLQKSVINKFESESEKLLNYSKFFKKALLHNLNEKENMLRESIKILNNLSPLNILERGYSICSNNKNDIVKNYKDVKIGDEINVLLANGKLICYVNSREEKNNG